MLKSDGEWEGVYAKSGGWDRESGKTKYVEWGGNNYTTMGCQKMRGEHKLN